MKSRTDCFDELIGEDLSGVTFVRDYLQLQFNPPLMINAYTPVTVRCGEDTAIFGEEGFANLLLAQLNKHVRAVEFTTDKALDIIFADEPRISVSLRPADYVGPEALNLFGGNKEIVVV